MVSGISVNSLTQPKCFMGGESEIYAELDRKWKATCRVLLGQEVGPLSDFEGYLSIGIERMARAKSAISGKDVFAPTFNVPQCPRYISSDEIPEFEKKMSAMPLSINSIKDLDSLISAVSERAHYCGNIQLGNSGGIMRSNRCTNVWYASDCADIYDSKYAAFCTDLRYVESMFGCSTGSESSFCIHALEIFRLQRCMETLRVYSSADCLYCASCEDCFDCMFCFCVKNRRNCIGNLELPKDKYATLKKKLVAEAAESMKASKAAPSIIGIINGD